MTYRAEIYFSIPAKTLVRYQIPALLLLRMLFLERNMGCGRTMATFTINVQNPFIFLNRTRDAVKLLITLETDETGMVVAECPSLPGCVSQGQTEAAAIANVREAIQGCLAARHANQLPLRLEVREVEVEVA